MKSNTLSTYILNDWVRWALNWNIIFLFSGDMLHLNVIPHAMSLWVNLFEWSSVHMGIENTYKVSSSHHGSNVFGRNSVHTGHLIMDESFWMKLSSHWAMSSWVEMFGWNSVQTWQCHHGSKCVDETQFTLGKVIMDHKVWMEFCSHCAMRSWLPNIWMNF
jgi:hypothetical protein